MPPTNGAVQHQCNGAVEHHYLRRPFQEDLRVQEEKIRVQPQPKGWGAEREDGTEREVSGGQAPRAPQESGCQGTEGDHLPPDKPLSSLRQGQEVVRAGIVIAMAAPPIVRAPPASSWPRKSKPNIAQQEKEQQNRHIRKSAVWRDCLEGRITEAEAARWVAAIDAA
jgi:hypothetical protein